MVVDRYYSRMWMHWVQATLFGSAGIGLMIVGAQLAAGTLTDMYGRRVNGNGFFVAGAGIFNLVIAALATTNIIQRRGPLIQLWRDGIDFRMVGSLSTEMPWWVPSKFVLLYSIVTGQGFRTRELYIPWAELVDVAVNGRPMAYRLEVHFVTGPVGKGERPMHVASFHQAELKDEPKAIADAINWVRRDPATIAKMPVKLRFPSYKLSH